MARQIFLLFVFISCNNHVDDNIEQHSILNQEDVEVYLLNILNDKRGYCIDMTGYKNNADINKSLQAHSCYSYQGEISVDQGFDKTKLLNEEFYISHFNVCMEADKIEKSSTLKLNSCDNNINNQRFVLQSDGKIHPKSNLNLCLTISESFIEGGGGNPVHLIRILTLENCNDELSSLQQWGIRKAD